MKSLDFFWRKPVFAAWSAPFIAGAACLSGCGWLGETPHDPVYQFQTMDAACGAMDYKNAFRDVFREESAAAASEAINGVFDCLIFKTRQYKNAIRGESLNKEQLKNLLNEEFIKTGNIAPAIDKITSPGYFDRFLNLKNIAMSLLGQQQASGGEGIRHRQICRDSGHKNSFIRMASAEQAAYPAPLPRADSLSKAEVDVFIQFLEDSRRFFLSLELASSLIFEELLQTDIAENGQIPLALFLEGRGGSDGEKNGLFEMPLEGAESEGWRRRVRLAEGASEEADAWRRRVRLAEGVSEGAAGAEAGPPLDSAAARPEGGESGWLKKAAAAAFDFAADFSESAVMRISRAFGPPEEAAEGAAEGGASADLSESAVLSGAGGETSSSSMPESAAEADMPFNDSPESATDEGRGGEPAASSREAGRIQEAKSAADYMEIYMLPLLEKRLAGSAPGFFQSIALNERPGREAGGGTGREAGSAPDNQPAPEAFLWKAGFSASAPAAGQQPEYLEKWRNIQERQRERSGAWQRHSERRQRYRQGRKRKKALEALSRMLMLHEPAPGAAPSEGFLTRGHVKYAVFNIMLAERVFRLYDSNRNFVLDRGETDSLLCFVEPVVSVISSLYLEGWEDGSAKSFYKWMASPQHAFYYTVRYKKPPGGTVWSSAGYGWQRLTGGLNEVSPLSYDGAVRALEALFARYFPYRYMGHKEEVREERAQLPGEDFLYP